MKIVFAIREITISIANIGVDTGDSGAIPPPINNTGASVFSPPQCFSLSIVTYTL